jgi:PAS domain S-box-containing protein
VPYTYSHKNDKLRCKKKYKSQVESLALLLTHSADTPYYFIYVEENSVFISPKLKNVLSLSEQWSNSSSLLLSFTIQVGTWVRQYISSDKMVEMQQDISSPLKSHEQLFLKKIKLVPHTGSNIPVTVGLIYLNKEAVHPAGKAPLAEKLLLKEIIDYEYLIESALSGTFYIDTKAQKSIITPALNQLRGYSTEKAPIPWEETILKEDLPMAGTFIERVSQDSSGVPHKAVFRHRHIAGHIVYIMAIAKARLTKSKKTSGTLYGFWLDITEQENLRQLLENALKEQDLQKKYLSALFNGIPEIVIVFNQKTGVITDCNATVQAKLGYVKQEIIGRHYTFIYKHKHKEQADTMFKAGSTSPFNSTITLLQKDGRLRPARISLTKSKLKDQQVIIAIYSDLTELGRAKEQLKNREALYRQLIQNSNEYITIMDPNFSVEWASENFSNLLGLSNDQLLGKKLSTFAHPEDELRVKAHFKAAVERGDTTVDFEGRFRTPDGKFIWMKSRSVFLTDDNGAQKIYTYRQDINREKAIEQKQQEMARLKNEFVSMTSHQLRTPMAVFASNLELLETLIPHEQTAVRRILKRMNTESDRMVHLLDEVLLLSRLESGIAEVPKHKKYDIVELIRTFCEGGICNNTHMQAELPKGPIWSSIDKEQFEHILMNLVSNAIKYTPAGRPKPDVSLHSVVDHAVLTIQDYGIGIPEEDQPRLFQQFVRAKNVSTIPGTGLGLYIVKRFADQNNIKITLKSQIKQGTTFYLNIPTL